MKLAIPVILTLSMASPLAAQPASPAPAPAPAAAPTGEQELIKMEEAWSKALVAGDSAALNRIVAPDWHGQNEDGAYADRAAMIRSIADGTDKITTMTNHDVHVRFIGADLAIVQGQDTETGTHKGKPANGVYSWTDVFQKRDGQWVAIASQNTPVKPK